MSETNFNRYAQEQADTRYAQEQADTILETLLDTTLYDKIDYRLAPGR